MKIILAALNAKYVHSNLAVYDLEAYARTQLRREQENAEVDEGMGLSGKQEGLWRDRFPKIEIKEYTINHNLDLILQSLYQERADVAAFSCYIWNIHEILTIARELSKVAPDTHIWLGGPEVSYDSVKLLEEYPFVEGIIQGEGEVTFYELVKRWAGCCGERTEMAAGSGEMETLKDMEYADVSGIVYRDERNRIRQNSARPLMNLNDVPFIYQDLSRFENKILYYETSRGCPFSCSYCLSSIDKSVRFRSMELVEQELQFFLDHNVAQVKFIDRTFNCRKSHALAIWRYIAEHDNGMTNFHFEVAADLIGEEELALFQTMRPGLIQLEIGLQSTNPATIREIHRVMDVVQLKKNMLAIRGFHNIHQHLDLIAGLPYEDFVTFKQSFNDAYEMKPNQLQLGFLKVLKGSYMGEQIEKYGLKYQDSQPYEVLSTKWISYDEILALKQVEEMVEIYYNSAQFEHVLNYLVPFFESPYACFEAIGTYYAVHHLYGIGFKREARYDVLRRFCMDMSGKGEFSMEILDSLLTYDYYLRENAKKRPVWSPDEPVKKQIYHDFFKRGGTEEVSLLEAGYDSKLAARAMHIEPVVREAVCWILEDGNLRKGNRKKEHCVTVNNGEECAEDMVYCLFDYKRHNAWSKDAMVTILSHL
ncbi:MAG: B12-binding domain-containing radical SAM protein [Lachnospiraceae bacterium]|nr:B12-binding domain-containing radical SAM protein [Lachnospiraceae bacterium]